MSKEKEKLMNRKAANSKVAAFIKDGLYPIIGDYGFAVTVFSVNRQESYESIEYKINIHVKELKDGSKRKDVISNYTYMYNAVQTLRKEINKGLKNVIISIYDIELD